ncbi:integrase [Escherichia coli]|nr:integrase [Escherichia coli]EFO3044771.1 integrase [Escherichia coli]QAZ84218.1 integrase [Escherichia coli]QAZ89047.1 integrase [Escherichia coli]TJJ20746.1 integrase [Escherichia coli]
MAASSAIEQFSVGNDSDGVTNGAIVIHTQRLKSDPGGNLLS